MVDGQVADYGSVFLHCTIRSPASAIMEVGDDQLIEGWPFRVHGDGHPCQPAAFTPGEKRFALKAGVNALPVAPSRGLAIRLKTTVHHIEIARHV